MLAAFKTPAVLGCLAAFFAAIGIEINHETTTHALEILAAVIALIGVVRGVLAARHEKATAEPLMEPQNRQRT